MNEARFRRLQRALLISTLVTSLALSAACGGTSTVEAPSDQGGPAQGEQSDQGGAGGGGATSGRDGATAGNSAAGNGAAAGHSAGSGGVAGSGAGAGMGGASAGMGGANGGSGGMGLAGSAGDSAICHAPAPQICAGGPITLPKSCVPEALAAAGTTLPLATCRTMCESIFTFSCKVSSVQETSIIVQCSTGCPASQP